jgi:hypothetical protein
VQVCVSVCLWMGENVDDDVGYLTASPHH